MSAELTATLRWLDQQRYYALPSAALLELFRGARDELAFGTLVRRYGGCVYRWCRDELGDRSLADDAFQAVFLALARQGPAGREDSRLAGWLRTVTRREARRLARRERRRRARESPAGVRPPDGPSPAHDPAAAEDLARAIRRAVARLPARYRDVVELHYFEGLSQAQVAARLAVPEGTVRTWLQRGRDRLRGPLGSLGVAGLTAAAPRTTEAATPELVGATVRAAAAALTRPGARAGRWVAAAAALLLGGGVVGVALGPRPDEAPTPPVAAEAVESLPDKNLRILRAEVLPRVCAALRPMVASGGEVRVVSTRAEGTVVEAVLEAEHQIGPWRPRSRARLRYCVLVRDLSAEYDALGRGDWKPINLHTPIWLGIGREANRPVRLAPLDEVLGAFELLPKDERAAAEVERRVNGPGAAGGTLTVPAGLRLVAANGRRVYATHADDVLLARDLAGAEGWRCLGPARFWELAADRDWLYGTRDGQLLVRPAEPVVCDWVPAGPVPHNLVAGGLVAAGGCLFAADTHRSLWARHAGPQPGEWQPLGKLPDTDDAVTLGADGDTIYACENTRHRLFRRRATLAEEPWRPAGLAPTRLRVVGWGGRLLGWTVGGGPVYVRPADDATGWDVFARPGSPATSAFSG
jgi:RNA polymerase sigma factor (sigma-70 family)